MKKNITRRLNYSRLTACDEVVFVKGTHDWIDLLCLLWAVQSRRCRRRRKDSGEKRGGAVGGELRSWCYYRGFRGRGPEAHRGPPAAECVHKPDAVRSGRRRSEGGRRSGRKCWPEGATVGAHIFCLDIFLESTKRLLLSASNIITQWWAAWMATVGVSVGVPVRQQRGSWGNGGGKTEGSGVGGGGGATSKRS